MSKSTLRIIATSVFILTLVMILSSSLFAQGVTGEIRGTIKDATTGEALIGANVVVTGTNLGASSNMTGNYIIRNVPPGQYPVMARFIGYRASTSEVTVSAGGTVTLNFSMSTTTFQMDEVVVTGQGVATEKRKLAAVVETISSKEIDHVVVKSIDQLLVGRIPGLTSYAQGGSPGSGNRIQTRGVKGALGQTTPVIYVDGVRVDNNDQGRLQNTTGGTRSSSLSDILTGDIDRIEVIKGGAAATLYGSEAANGVIQIFTKKGTPGAIRWSANMTSGIDKSPLNNIYEDYTKDNLFQTGQYQSYKLGATGGSETMSYNVSGRMSENTGVVKENELLDRTYNLSSGLRVVVGEEASIEFSGNYSYSKWGRIFNDNSSLSMLSNMELEGRFQLSPNKDSLLRLHHLPEQTEESNRLTFSTNFSYRPFSFWNNQSVVGVDYRKSEDRIFTPIEAGAWAGQAGGYLYRADREYRTLTLSHTASFKLPDLGPVSQNFVAGAQGFRVDDREIRGTGTNFKLPGTKDFDNASVRDGEESNRELFSYGFIFQDQIGVWNKLFFDLGVRFDGNSTFGKEIPIQSYPKVGFAYNISEESFWPEMIKPYFGNLKIRAAWGQTGNFPPPYTRDRQYSAVAYMAESGFTFGNPGNLKLGPEKTTSTDIGFDASFLDERISVEFSSFKQITSDAMFTVPEDPAAGLSTQRRNVGEIENTGIEVTLRAQVLNFENLQMNIRASYATVDNVVKSLGGSTPFTVAGFAFAPARVEEGMAVGIIRASKPRLESDGTYRGNWDDVFVGTPTPKQTASFSLDAVILKDISFSTLIEGAFGHYILNQSLSRRVVNALSNPALYQDVLSIIPKVEAGSTAYTRNTASYFLVEKGDWMKIREISLRYRAPKLFFNGITLSASVRNVLTFGTKATKVDPETSFIPSGTIELGGIVGATIEAPRQFRLGIDVIL